MACIVITALSGEGDGGPCKSSLALASAAREIGDRFGATIYACLCLGPDEDIDRWVTALGQAGVDRIACARSGVDGPSDDIVHVELVRRLEPRLVLVPVEVPALAQKIADALEVRLVANATISSDGGGLRVGDCEVPSEDVVVASVTAPPATDVHGGDDIDVLFFAIEAETGTLVGSGSGTPP